MKKLFILLAIFTSFATMAQSVGINADGSAANASAMLDVSSTTIGFLPPRMTNAQRTAISEPAAGLMVWCTDCGVSGEMQVYNGVIWMNFSGAAALSPCGAFVSPGVFKVFACYNLGATDTTVDPNVPVQAIHGNYYQWGRIAAVADANTSAAAIVGWNTTTAANGAWIDGSKTVNDPCPNGFRVPTKTQWDGVILNNTVSRVGSWLNDGNFTSAISWGPNISTKTLTLPAAGYRSNLSGTLSYRGSNGYYWSSTENGSYAWYLSFYSSSAIPGSNYRSNGISVRCVSE
jgi:uncharacterized protein (TIGR02145 family)